VIALAPVRIDAEMEETIPPRRFTETCDTT
jgi:hypothetical protein